MSTGSNDNDPADKPRPDYVTSRLRYFDGEFLSTQDFVDEQNYHVDRQARHEACLHAPGILEGLEVTQAGNTSVNVGFGSAVDTDGNQILVSDAEGNSSGDPIEVTFDSSSPDDGDYIVDILFVEKKTDPQHGSEGKTRFSQDPAPGAVDDNGSTMLAIGTSPRDGAVPLARVRVTNGVIDGIDTDYFSTDARAPKYAGLRLPGNTGEEGTVRFENIQENSDGYYPNENDYPDPDYKITFDQRLFLKQPASSGGTSLEIEKGALIFLDGPGDIWAHGYNQRILLHDDGVELLAKNNITLTTNNTGGDNPDNLDQENAIHTLVAHSSGNVGIGIGDEDPAARLEIKGDSVNAGLQVTSSDGNALLTVADSGDTTVSGPLTAESSLVVTDLLTASGGLQISNTQIYETGFVSIGHDTSDENHPLEVWSSDTKLFVVNDSHVNAWVSLQVQGGLTVKDSDGDVLLDVSSSGIDASLLLNANDGLAVTGSAAVSDTLTANSMAIGSTSAPTNPLEVYDGSGNQLLAVSDSGGLTVTGTATVSEYTFPSSATPSDMPPLITARRVPSSQGNSNDVERSELILFASNDTSTSCGPDAITLRAPALRLQTYSDATVSDIDNDGGCNDRLYISPNGKVSIGKSYYPENGSHWLEVWDPSQTGSSDSALLEVHNDKINTSVVINANDGIAVAGGMTLNGASSLLGAWGQGSYGTGTNYQAASDGFVVVYLVASDKEQRNATGKAGADTNSLQTRGVASVHRDTGGSNTVAVDQNSFMMPVRKGEYWKVSVDQDDGASGNPANASVTIRWIPFGN